MVWHSHSGKFVNYMAQFYRNTLKEVSSGRHIIEQIFDRKLRSIQAGYRFLFDDFTAFYADMCTQFIFAAFGFHIHLRDSRDRGQSLTSETKAGEAKQVVGLYNFRSSVTFPAHAGVGRTHTKAIIDDLN